MEIDTSSHKEVIDVPPEESKNSDTAKEASADLHVVTGRPVEGTISPLKNGNIIIGTLNVFNAPAQKYIGEPLRRRYHKHYHPRHKHGMKHLIADIFLGVTVVALLGVNIYAFFFSTPGLQENVVMTLGVTPEIIRSGDQVTITVDYENRSDTALLDAALSILCPCNTSPIAVEPADIYDAKTHTFRIGTIEPHGNGSIRFSWLYLGTVGTTQHFSAALSYGAKNALRRETKSVVWRSSVNASALALTIAMPEEFVHEGTVPFTLHYANRGTRPLANVRIEPVLPSGSTFLSFSPQLVDGALTLSVLPPGGEGTVSGQLAFRGDGATETMFVVRTYLGEARIAQEEVQHRASVFYSKLTLAPISDDAETALALGTDAPFLFSYENGETSDIVDLSLTVHPPELFFDINTKTVLSLSKVNDPSLAFVRAKAKGTLTLSVPIKTSVSRMEAFGDGDPRVRIPYTFSYRLASAPQKEIRIERVMERNVESDFTLDAFGRYFSPEGDQLGRGPLPPRVGDTTKYWVFIPLANTFSDVKDVTVTATLGEHVAWTRKASITLGAPLTFDERTRTLTWRIPLVTKFTGGDYPDVGAAIEVALTPEARDSGIEPVLITDIHVRGHDTFTNTTIERGAMPVTTRLTVDRKAKDKSIVVP